MVDEAKSHKRSYSARAASSFKPEADAKVARCDVAGCANPAGWSPVLVLRAPASLEPCPPIRSSITIGVCTICKHEIGVADLLSDAGWDRILAGVRTLGQVAPDRKRTTVDWETVRERDEAFEAAERTRGH